MKNVKERYMFLTKKSIQGTKIHLFVEENNLPITEGSRTSCCYEKLPTHSCYAPWFLLEQGCRRLPNNPLSWRQGPIPEEQVSLEESLFQGEIMDEPAVIVPA